MEAYGNGQGASKTSPKQCSAFRVNDYILIKGHPCKIVEMTTSETEKHGHAKVSFVGEDIFTGKQYEDICPSTHNMNVPHVKRKDYQLVDIGKDGAISLMEEDGEMREDLKLEGDIGGEIKKKFEHLEDDASMFVTVQYSMDTELVVGFAKGK